MMITQTASEEKQRLHFAVLDEEDLSVMSAHLQDADLKVGDMAFLAASQCFAVVACRVDWDSLATGRPARREAGFHFSHVRKVQRVGFNQTDLHMPLQLLTISFAATDTPAGEVLLTFAGGRMVKLAVECLEAEMRDLGACWPVERCPSHDLDAMRVAG